MKTCVGSAASSVKSVGQRESARHDADDAPRDAVELDDLVDDARIAAEAVLPDAVAEDDHRRAARTVLVLREAAARAGAARPASRRRWP